MYNHQRIKGRDVRKGRKGIFCGYVPRSDAYKVWIISESKYDFTGDVTWNENELQPLIQQANILETGEGTVNSSLPQSTQKTVETSTPLCSSDREQATSTNNEEREQRSTIAGTRMIKYKTIGMPGWMQLLLIWEIFSYPKRRKTRAIYTTQSRNAREQEKLSARGFQLSHR